VIADLA